MQTRCWPVPETLLALTLLVADQAAAQARTFRRGIDARAVVPNVGDDQPPELVLPSPFAMGPAPARGPRGEAEAFGDDRMLELLRFFVKDETVIQGAGRPGMFTVSGSADECSLAQGAFEGVRARLSMQPVFGAWLCLDSGEVPLQAARDGLTPRFEARAARPVLPADSRLDEVVVSGLVTTAPAKRTMLWTGFRATERKSPTAATSVWAHGSGLLQLGERWIVAWDGPLQGTLAVRADLRAGTGAFDTVRPLPLGALLRPGTSPRPLLLGQAAQREAEPTLTLDRIHEALGTKGPARAALARAKLRLFQDVLLAGGDAADLATLTKAFEAACDVPQLRFEVRYGRLPDTELARLEQGQELDPAVAAKQSSIDLPSVLGQPFGVAFVTESAGKAPQGLELEGLSLARADGDVTLVARLAIEPPLARDGAASRAAQEKRIVQLRLGKWCVLERGRGQDGAPHAVLVRACRR